VVIAAGSNLLLEAYPLGLHNRRRLVQRSRHELRAADHLCLTRHHRLGRGPLRVDRRLLVGTADLNTTRLGMVCNGNDQPQHAVVIARLDLFGVEVFG
jgi:hypothetical protein